jgi:hypothetical protein
MRFAWLAFVAPLSVVACAESVPRSALNRCNLGVSDGNDGYVVRQGAACRIVAQALAADEKPTPAVSFARKACDLQDPSGCVLYLTLSRAQPGELTRARATGEKACDGMVVSSDGTDARPRLCFLAAELYDELEPRSADEAGRLYARACKLGDDRACPRARALGVDPDAKPPANTANTKASPTPPKPAPPTAVAPTPTLAPTSTVVTQVVAPACHALRGCVQLDLQQRNVSEVVGTITNRCDHAVQCRWCPSKGTDIERTLCHSGTLQPGETRTGQSWGLWYDGFNAMAYDCIGENDAQGCLAL